MQNRPKTFALVAATAALTVAFAIFLAPHFTQSIAARNAQIVAKVQDRAPTLDTTQIMPADVLGTAVVSWAPLTGDGSN